MNIILGTAQFGLDYGVSNYTGQVDLNEVKNILTLCSEHGVCHFDTAQAYGDSESILGMTLGKDASITSKVPSLDNSNYKIGDWIRASVEKSISNLGRTFIDELLFHRVTDILNGDKLEIASTLSELKTEGIIRKAGVSVYDFDNLHYLIEHFDIDVIQAPFNIFDRRLVDEGWADVIKNNNIRLDVRSVFLQGLLLMSNEQRNNYFSQWKTLWVEFDSWQVMHPQFSKLDLCLQFVKQYPQIDNVVIGVQSTSELQQVLSSFYSDKNVTMPSFNCSDINLLNPSRWNLI